MRSSLRRLLECLAVALCLAAFASRASSGDGSEYALKAAYLYNFALYTEWPGLGADFQICILGKDGFGSALDPIARKEVAGRSIRINRLQDDTVPADCNLLYITEAKLGRLPDIVRPLAGLPILTVAENGVADARLAMLSLRVERGALVFGASPALARAAGLNFSAKMLRLAHHVY